MVVIGQIIPAGINVQIIKEKWIGLRITLQSFSIVERLERFHTTQKERGLQITEKWSEWINAGKLTDFDTGNRILIVYANTDNMTWHIGVIIND
jgi:hypothetical protein